MRRTLEAEARRRGIIRQSTRTIPPLAEFVEESVQFSLHDWQRYHLCPTLERFRKEKGIRLLIHGPPQFGKSIIMSKRFPAWLLAHDPLARIVMAGYNVNHARDQFAEQVRNLMQSEEFRANYPQAEIPIQCSAEAFSTLARLRLNDGQDSIVAVGLLSGFTGKGLAAGDALLMDDPYASPDDANSAAVNDRVWRFWDDNAKNRVHPEANVAVLFHRYHENDLAGRLLETGKWEYIRFPAIADSNLDRSDPTGRQRGEPLSPMWSLEDMREIEAENPQVFAGQWQGDPKPASGGLFRRDYFNVIDEIPPLTLWVRFWDLAVGVKESNDWTVGAVVGVRENGAVVVADIQRWRREWPETRDGIAETQEPGIVGLAVKDDAWIAGTYDVRVHAQRPKYLVGVEEVGTQKGFVQDLHKNDLFLKIPLLGIPAKGDKKERAATWAARGATKGIEVVRGAWNEPFIKECLSFRGLDTDTDDQIDAVSGAVELLARHRGGQLAGRKIIKPNTPAYWEQLSKQAKRL